jgi:hypothetical protein
MYLLRTLDTKVKMLENIYKMLSESRMIYAMVVWGSDGEKKLTKFTGYF